MRDVKRAQDLIGNDVYDREGGKIGRVGNVYLDDATQQPEWITVRTGLFGSRESFVPLAGAATAGENALNVGVSREKVREAPKVEAQHGHLSDQEGRTLYEYYGLQQGPSSPQEEVPQQQSSATREHPPQGTSARPSQSSGPASPARYGTTGQPTTETQPRTQERSEQAWDTRTAEQPSWATTPAPTPEPETGTTQRAETARRVGTTGTQCAEMQPEAATAKNSTGPHTMTRSEERLRVTTEYVESGRVRLRKYVTTEQETVTVPITREEVRIEREAIPESERRTVSSGGELGTSEKEIILHEERPVVRKESVPVERIIMRAEQIIEEKTVQGEVRREIFDIDDETGKYRKQSQ